MFRILDGYHRIIFLFGSAFAFFNWSRIISVDSKSNFSRFLLLLILVSVIGFAYERYVNRRLIPRPEIRFYAIMWLGVCGFYLLLGMWNSLFLDHIAASGYAGDIFRTALQTFYAPYYGLPQPARFMPALAIAACIGLFVLLSRRMLALEGPEAIRCGMRLLPLFYLLFVGLFAVSDSSQRLFENTLAFAEFGTTGNLAHFDSLSAVWRDWNAEAPRLRGRINHYPPGTLYLAMIERDFELDGLFKALVIILATLCIPLTAAFCGILEYHPRTTVLALILFCSSASMLVFPTTAFTPLTAFFTLAALVGVGLAVVGPSRYAIAGGIAIGICSLISFAVAFSGLLIGLFITALVFMGGLSINKAWRILLYLLSTVSVLWGGLYLVTGFNILDCLIVSIANNTASTTQDPFDHALRYLLRACGNLFAYTGYLGVVISLCAGLGALHASKGGVILRAFAFSTIATLLIASFSTLFYLETERIWVFLSPPLIVLAAWGVASAVPREKFRTVALAVAAAALISSSAQEIFMTHYIPADEYINVESYLNAREILRERG